MLFFEDTFSRSINVSGSGLSSYADYEYFVSGRNMRDDVPRENHEGLS